MPAFFLFCFFGKRKKKQGGPGYTDWSSDNMRALTTGE